jgi:hypothetical protein
VQQEQEVQNEVVGARDSMKQLVETLGAIADGVVV